jgi:hypothetical protein
MAAATLATLVNRTRRFVGDIPDLDTITASCTSSATSISVADTTKYTVGQKIELDYETMLVRALASGTSLTVSRGMFDSTAATHASGASVLRPPNFLFADYRDALNSALDACFPLLYREVIDESLSALAGTYEYTIPNMPGTYDGDTIVIPYISKVWIRDTGSVPYRRVRNWHILRGTTPKLVFRGDPVPGTIRLRGFGPFPYLSATADTLDALFPKRAERLLTTFAAQQLLAAGEARRVRSDTGVTDTREQANRTGSSMAASSSLYQRFQISLANLAMPPVQKENVPTF